MLITSQLARKSLAGISHPTGEINKRSIDSGGLFLRMCRKTISLMYLLEGFYFQRMEGNTLTLFRGSLSQGRAYLDLRTRNNAMFVSVFVSLHMMSGPQRDAFHTLRFVAAGD